MKLVECVPNFSEGRDRNILDAIAAAITSVEGVRLLDVDPGAATNRTVVTFVGSIEAAEQAAFLAVKEAAARIDMRRHTGAHARMGATDVCPFVPLGETTMAECVAIARRLGRRIGEELGIPVYLYEEAAATPGRRSLADIRRGEYEGLADKLKEPAWKPDFGPASPNAKSGATAVGAREFLIAYNVNLNTRDRRLANRIAQEIRETGRPRRDPDGKAVRDASGAILTEPGSSMLETVRATGWYIEEFARAQVSINLTDYKTTPPHAAFEAVEREAAALGLRVTGSEIVGLVPLEAIRMAGRHYLARQGKSPAQPEAELVRVAIQSLGLEDVSPFDPARKIIEHTVAGARPLASSSLDEFTTEVSSPSPAPGGGSVAALAGALAGALTAMVASITYDKKGFEASRDELARIGTEAHAVKARLQDGVDADARAFDGLLEANRMPRGTEEERGAREEVIRKATLGAIEVPLSVMKDSASALDLAGEIAERGVPSALSDAGVAALMAAAAVEAAYYNVTINLAGLTDAPRAARIRDDARELMARATDRAREITTRVRKSLEG